MPLSLEEGDVDERLAVDLEEVERREDPPSGGGPGEGVAVAVDLELLLVLPVGHEHPVDDRGLAARERADRVVELARTVDRAGVPDEAVSWVSDADKGPGAGPLRLQDVSLRLGPLAGVAGLLGGEIGPDLRVHWVDSRVSQPLDTTNVCSKMRERLFCPEGSLADPDRQSPRP